MVHPPRIKNDRDGVMMCNDQVVNVGTGTGTENETAPQPLTLNCIFEDLSCNVL